MAWGAGHLGLGARWLIRRPRLAPWALAPAVVALGLLYGAWVGAWEWVPWLLHALLPRPAAAGVVQNLWNGLAFLLILWAFATTALLLYGALGALGAPFYDRIAAAVEAEVAPERVVVHGWRDELWAIGVSIVHSLLALGLWLGVLLGLALLNVVPGVGTLLELVGSWVATGLFLSREMMDGTLSRRGYSFGEKLAVVRGEPAILLGFGLVTAVALLIPLVNVLSLPVAVVGGTLLFLELETAGRVPVRPGQAAAGGGG